MLLGTSELLSALKKYLVVQKSLNTPEMVTKWNVFEEAFDTVCSLFNCLCVLGHNFWNWFSKAERKPTLKFQCSPTACLWFKSSNVITAVLYSKSKLAFCIFWSIFKYWVPICAQLIQQINMYYVEKEQRNAYIPQCLTAK